jgi:hypothetical protein
MEIIMIKDRLNAMRLS